MKGTLFHQHQAYQKMAKDCWFRARKICPTSLAIIFIQFKTNGDRVFLKVIFKNNK